MYKRLVVLSVAVVVGLIASTVLAQCSCGAAQTYAPVVPSYVTYYAPATYVTSYMPATPQVAYYAPVARPYVTTYYAQVARPYAAYYAPVARPYVAYYGRAGWSIYGTPKVYVPGEPVRNVVRAVTP